jgi:PadR family transcriptional regulator
MFEEAIDRHAAREALVGFWMIEELRRHGYEMSPGTIYPLLHSLEKKGYLSVEVKREGAPRLA